MTHPTAQLHTAHRGHSRKQDSATLNHTALQATIHCLSGCAIGEVLGMVLGTAFGWSSGLTIMASVLLAFISGYAMTMRPLLRAGQPFRAATRIALAADTASIAIMEVVDNAVMIMIPGAMNSALDSVLFWSSLGVSLLLVSDPQAQTLHE